MSLLGEFQAAALGRGTTCPVVAVYEALPPGEQAELLEGLALDPKRLPGSAITRVLRGRGFTLGSGAVASHRAGRCSCRLVGS